MWHITENSLPNIPEQIGVYRLYAFQTNGSRISIQCFAGVDNSGILSIEQTTKQNLKKRIYNLLATIRQNGKTSNHSGALKYKTNVIIRITLAEHLLYFDFEVCENPFDREKELLKDYAAKFGENPPLNK
jgi:hypothetical protein